MSTTAVPDRKTWKRDLARYLEADERRSLGQIAGVVIPYLSVWAIAAIVMPGALLAVGLGLVATVFLVRMYSLFHDLTHNSMFASRKTNVFWGYTLGFLLFTPYRWWQRQHAIHHAHTGNLEGRGPGEIYTMTLAEYAAASRRRKLGYRLYRNPLPDAARGPQPRLPVRAPLPAEGDEPQDPGQRHRHQPGPRGLGGGLEPRRRPRDLPDHPGNDDGRRRGRGRLDALHPAPVRGHLLHGSRPVAVRARRAPGQLLPRPAAPARLGRRATRTSTTSTTSARRSRTTTSAPRTPSSPCSSARRW